MKQCGHKGCIREGEYMPFITVRLAGQGVVENPIKLQIPMYLCEKHKDEASPNAMITEKGRRDFQRAVLKKYMKPINWDTIGLVWQKFKPRIIH